MIVATVLFWVVLTASLFLAGLAQQIRWFAGHSLRKALEEEWPAIEGLTARKAIAAAARPAASTSDVSEHETWLRERYPLPLGIIAKARRALPVLLFVAVGALAAGRFQGVI